ncbi:hypothetical protein C8R44DRAFT_981648 [Mycena epipterygia]|nr:hypothetical protein C8R44DRAFT_981648 [Mycena epipterygia]
MFISRILLVLSAVAIGLASPTGPTRVVDKRSFFPTKRAEDIGIIIDPTKRAEDIGITITPITRVLGATPTSAAAADTPLQMCLTGLISAANALTSSLQALSATNATAGVPKVEAAAFAALAAITACNKAIAASPPLSAADCTGAYNTLHAIDGTVHGIFVLLAAKVTIFASTNSIALVVSFFGTFGIQTDGAFDGFVAKCLNLAGSIKADKALFDSDLAGCKATYVKG